MNNRIEILLGERKNIKSVNSDNSIMLELKQNASEINEFAVNDVVSATEVFDIERENNEIYRIYGRIEYLSLLNGLANNYSKLDDFFNPVLSDSKDIFNSFDFYLVAPSSGATYDQIPNTNTYKRCFSVIATKNNFELYRAGFSNNVYGEQTYIFGFNVDIDISKYIDYLGFPLSELYLYAQYKIANKETMYKNVWYPSGTTRIFKAKEYNVGDIIESNNGTPQPKVCDVIEYTPDEFIQTQKKQQEYVIQTPYGTKKLEWKYNPFIPLRLRYFESEVNTARANEIIKNSTTLRVIDNATPTSTIELIKSGEQVITEINMPINDWDINTTPNYSWDSVNGELTFLNDSEYNIIFEVEPYITVGSSKYNIKTNLQKYTGTIWEDISGTTNIFVENNIPSGFIIDEYFNTNNKIRIVIQLIPNLNKTENDLVPDYAKLIKDEGKYVWRDILPQGYTEQLTGLGVDYPFLNGRRYLFSSIILDVAPNLDNPNTKTVFNEISYMSNAKSINTNPITELNNFGKPCQ